MTQNNAEDTAQNTSSQDAQSAFPDYFDKNNAHLVTAFYDKHGKFQWSVQCYVLDSDNPEAANDYQWLDRPCAVKQVHDDITPEIVSYYGVSIFDNSEYGTGFIKDGVYYNVIYDHGGMSNSVSNDNDEATRDSTIEGVTVTSGIANVCGLSVYLEQGHDEWLRGLVDRSKDGRGTWLVNASISADGFLVGVNPVSVVMTHAQ